MSTTTQSFNYYSTSGGDYTYQLQPLTFTDSNGAQITFTNDGYVLVSNNGNLEFQQAAPDKAVYAFEEAIEPVVNSFLKAIKLI